MDDKNLAYSLEFRRILKDRTKKESEVFFLIPPKEDSETQTNKVTTTKTLNGYYVNDFGVDLGEISLNFNFNSQYIGLDTSHNLDTSIGQLATRTISNIAQSTGLQNPFDGTEQILLLSFILDASRRRDEAFFNSYSSLSTQSTFKSFDLEKLFSLAKETALDHEKVEIIYHSYKYSKHFSIVINRVMFGQSATDPYGVEFTINATVVKKYPFKIEKYNIFQPQFLDSQDVFRDLQEQIEGYISYGNIIPKYGSAFGSLWGSAFSAVGEINEKLVETINGNLYFLNLGFFKDILDTTVQQFDNIINTWETEFFDEDDVSNNENYVQALDTKDALNAIAVEFKKVSIYYNEDLENSTMGSVTRYKKREIKSNDDLYKIATEEIGDMDTFNKILSLSKITSKNIDSKELVGKKILLPIKINFSAQDFIKNEVFFWKDSAEQLVNGYLFGIDLLIDEDRGIVINQDGVVGTTTGKKTLQNIISSILSINKGDENPALPNLGIEYFTSLPANNFIEKMKMDIYNQITANPLVARCEIKSTSIIAGRLTTVIEVFDYLDELILVKNTRTI